MASGTDLPDVRSATDLPADAPAYDVVVVGFGIAGGCAALEAARAGASVLLLERAAVHGGTSSMSGGHFYLGAGTAVQQATGQEDSVEEMVKYLTAVSKEPEPDKIQAYAEGSVEHFDWLEALGFEFERSYYPEKAVIQPGTQGLMYTGNEKVWPFSEQAVPAPRGHKVPVPGDTEGTRIVLDLIRDRLEEERVEVRYETGVSHLVTDDAGAVVGVAWRSFDETGYLRAKAVVMAAGGFVMNPDMVAQYTPALGSKLFTLGSTYDDGLGIRLGQSVGAELKHMDEPFITAPIYPPSILLTGILVNSDGQRFVAEDSYHSRTSQFVMEQPDSAAYLIVDSEHGELTSYGMLVPMIDAYDTIAELETALDLPSRLGPAVARPLQRARRERRGPGLPQGRELPRGPGQGPVGGVRPPARQGDVRRVHPRRHPRDRRRPGAAPRRLGDRGPVRRGRLRLQPRPGRQGLLLRHPARRGVVLRRRAGGTRREFHGCR